MKTDRRLILGSIILISLGIIFVLTILYHSHNEQPHPYDRELLEIDLDSKIQQQDVYSVEIIPESAADGQDAVPDEHPDKGVTSGSCYNEELVAEGSKNILILGEDDENRLYDAIGVISIDSKDKKVSIIMLPRDMYVKYSKLVRDTIKSAGKADVPGIYKLNAAHHIGAMIGYKGKFNVNSISFLAQVIKEKFRIDVDDYIKINIDGFVQVVDLFGGVVVEVPYDINQGNPAQGISTLLSRGERRLDGNQAESFVRFRQGYRADGTKFDVDRKINQLAFINAFIRQHGTISNIDKIPGLLKTLGRNIMHSMSLGDTLFTYLNLAKRIINENYTIEEKNINGESIMKNNVSYIIIN